MIKNLGWAWDWSSLLSAEEVAHIYGKIIGRDRKLGRRTVKQDVREGE